MNKLPVWYEREEVPDGIDLRAPGIYEWHIEGVGSYIGKATRLSSRFREYPNNIRKLAFGLPYRKGKPTAFRHIHKELEAARKAERTVTYRVIENCRLEELNVREQHWIKLRGTLNGKPSGPGGGDV